MKIVYLPLDERPCNNSFIKMVATTNDQLNIITINNDLLGLKKRPASYLNIKTFLLDSIDHECDALILPIEMLVYGGLVYSRLHYEALPTLLERLALIKEIKQLYPNLKIYCANLIMRTPSYSSSDEEPDYYQEYGSMIFKQAYLMDQQNRSSLDEVQLQELNSINEQLPQAIVADYALRRSINIQVTKEVLNYLKEGYIDNLIIPQDDSAPFGYTALDQMSVKSLINELDLHNLVSIYPGADEVGLTLVTKAYVDYYNLIIKVYPIFSSVHSQSIIPLYEDRPLYESIKAHVDACGLYLSPSYEQANLIIGYNTSGLVMQEAYDQFELRDITYETNRNLKVFVKQLKLALLDHKKVCVVDSAYSNGGDYELIKLLDYHHILDQLVSYKGWNTNCNSLGTSLASSVLADLNKQEAITTNLIYHILDDAIYQPYVKKEITQHVLPLTNNTYFKVDNNVNQVLLAIDEMLLQQYQILMKNSFKDVRITALTSHLPWSRMFEVALDLSIEKTP
ncbi:MAG: DUF4127 family protein [Bacilli bacterium]